MKHILICLLFAVPLGFCSAQSHYFRHYQVENGLSNNTVYCSVQDKNGFLWFGTKDGLNRFDGYSFKVFRHNVKDKSSIVNNLIHALHIDHTGNLWVGTDQGLDIYNSKTESFTHVGKENQDAVRCIITDRSNNCWYIAGWSVIHFDIKTGKITNYKSIQAFEATSVIEKNDGSIWVTSIAGTLEKLDTKNNKFKSYSVFNHSKWVASHFIEKIFRADDDNFFIGTSNQGLKIFNSNTGIYKDILTYNKDKTEIYVRDIIKYSVSEYWIATESGLFIYDLKKGSFTNIQKRYNDPYSISDNAIYCLYKDIEGGVWAGTYFGGVNYYPKPYATFSKFYPSTDRNSIQGNVVREICKDQYGNLWIGTEDNGLNKLSTDKRSWSHYSTGVAGGLSNTNIHGLLANGQELFVGTFERGLDVLDIPSGKVVRNYLVGKGNNVLKSNFMVCLYKTRQGLILTGTTRGLYKYNAKEKNFVAANKMLSENFVYSILEDHTGKIWIGTVRDGIYIYDPQTTISTKLNYDYPIKNALNNSVVNGLFEDSSYNLWFATEGLGLWKYNPGKNQYKFYDSKNGLPSSYVFKVLEDHNKNIWISTTRGLVNLNPFTEKLSVYTKENGLLSDQFNYNSAYKDTDGTMYFGCVKGMVSFNPLQFQKNNFTPAVYITGFQLNNQELGVRTKDSLLNTSIIFAKKINLKYNQSSFSIDFAGLSYSAPEMIKYKYKMHGLDKGWTYLKKNRKVYFTQLSPGRYSFIVKAASNNGNWSQKETRLEINISPPFWKSFWAYTAYMLLTLILIYYALKLYHLKIREKNSRLIEMIEHDKERQIYNAKIEFFTNVAHEIRTPLTLIKGPMEKVIKKAESVPEIHSNLKIMEKNTDRLLDLTNQLLDFRKTETSSFSLNFVRSDVTTLIIEIYLQFKFIADQKGLLYTLKHQSEHLFAYIDFDAFTKILNNLVNNAIKYSMAKVEIELLAQGESDCTFAIEIRNDGYLVPDEMKTRIFEPFFRMKESEKQVGTGIGLSLSRSLAELHKGRLIHQSKNELNVFILTLPVHQDKEFDLSDSNNSKNPEMII